MPTMIVGTAILKKGIEVAGLVPLGNAIRIMARSHRASINRGIFVEMPYNEDIYTLPETTYTFEEDTPILLTRIVQDDLTILYEGRSISNVPLIQDTESEAVASATVLELTTTGSISYVARIENSDNQDIAVTVRVYSGGLVVSTDLATITAKSTMDVSRQAELTSSIAADTIVHFTIESSDSSSMIMGALRASTIQITRRT